MDASRDIGRGVFTLILIGSSFVDLPIAHKTLSRRVVALVIRVKTLKQVVAATEELAQSVWVIDPREVSTSLVTSVLLGVDARGRRGAREELQEGLQVMVWQAHGCILHRSCKATIGPHGIVQPVRPC
jgi:hypothetical protein